MRTNTLIPDFLHSMDAYWRAANDLSVGQMYLYDNPLLNRLLTLADVIRRRSAWISGVCLTVG